MIVRFVLSYTSFTNYPLRVSVTDLEGVTLGCVATQGPCTAYHVRRQFQLAPSARFTGSAGAIYPLLRRLQERELVVSEKVPTGKRPALEYSITRAGRKALREWLYASLEPATAFADDPLRTRMLFLQELSPKARRAWLEQAESVLREQEGLIEAYGESVEETVWVRLANENARQLNRARMKWLAKAKELLEREGK